MTDPRARIVALFLLGLLLLAVEGAAPLALAAVLAGVGLLRAPGVAGWRLRILAGFALLTWSTVLSQALFYADWPRTPLLSLGPLTLWREGALHGLTQSARFLALTAAGIWLAVSTPTDRLLAALRALRVPFGLTLMGVAVVRFVPMVGGEWVAVRAARAARGRPTWARGPWAWLRLEVALLRPVLARSIRRARALAESLETRGFHPTAPRAVREPLRFSGVDTLAVGGLSLLTVATLAARLLFVAYGLELYYHPSLRPLYGFVRAWL